MRLWENRKSIISAWMQLLTFDEIPFNNSLLFPSTVRNLDFKMPMAGVRPIKLLMREVSPVAAAVGSAVGGGDEGNILSFVYTATILLFLSGTN